MKLKMVKLCGDASLNTYFEKNILYPKDYPYDIKLEMPTVMAIDPGTNAMGFSIGKKDEKCPIIAGVINRNKQHPNESNTDQYTIKLINIVMEIAKAFSVEELIIEDQFLIPKFKESYRRLTTLKDMILGQCGINGIKTYQVKPQEWKSIFLADIKDRYNINMSESNKEWVQKKMRRMYPSALNLNEMDASDAFGILVFYYDRYLTEDDDIMEIKPGYQKEWSHIVKHSLGKVKKGKYDEAMELAEALRKIKNRKKVRMAVLDETLDLEENIRSLTTISNDIFIAFTNPYGKIMPEMMKNRDKIGNIDSNSELYVLFYRENMKGGL